MCRDLAGRVQGLAMSHNLLSAAGWSSVKLTDLATEVIHSTLQLVPSDQRMFVHVSSSSIEVTPDQASTLALVINELATNTIKHGRKGTQSPSISVRIEENDGQILLEYRDNGSGYPESILDEEGYKARFRATAESQVKGALLLDMLAENEGIKVEESEVDEKIRESAEQRNQDYDALKKFYEQNTGARENLKDQLKENKVFAFLKEKAVIKEVPRDEIVAKPESA